MPRYQPLFTARMLVNAMAVLVLSGCATSGERPVPLYEGTDAVTDIRAEAIVGSWQLSVLNPREGQQSAPTSVTYAADGSFTAVLPADPQAGSAIGNAELTLTGNWSTAGGLLTTDNIVFGSNGEDEFAALMADLMNGMSGEFGNAANVYEQSDDHLILVGEDGVATRYDRQ